MNRGPGGTERTVTPGPAAAIVAGLPRSPLGMEPAEVVMNSVLSTALCGALDSEAMMSANLYFAYGSNLNRDDWRRWCAARGAGHLADGLRPVGRAVLPDRRLGFTRRAASRAGGVLDVLPARGHVVDGALFAVDDATRDLLDAKEGAPVAYRRVGVTVFAADGHPVPAFTYEVPDHGRLPHIDPSPAYLQVVRHGCESFGIPLAPLAAAAADLPPAPAVRSVFAYGTLMRGEPRFACIEPHGLVDARPAHTAGRLVSFGPWPGMLAGDDRVHGEVLEVTDIAAALADLDAVEGFLGYDAPGSLFVRVLVAADTGEGEPRRCWAYRYAGSAAGEPIPGGNWREHRRRAPAA